MNIVTDGWGGYWLTWVDTTTDDTCWLKEESITDSGVKHFG